MLIQREKINSIIFLLCISWGIFFFSFCAEGMMSNVRDVVAVSDTNSISIKWARLTLQETEGILVLRKNNTCPVDVYDGEIIYRGNGSKFTDREIEKKNDYCYGVCMYDSSGYFSSLKTSGIIRTRSKGEYVLLILENNIFIGLGLVVIVILIFLNIRKRRDFN